MGKPFMKKDGSDISLEKDNPQIDNGNGKITKDTTVYTGNTSKKLIVHICQQRGNELIEVDKPVTAKIWHQDIQWRGRQYPVIPSRFFYDYQGIAHQNVDVNDVSVLTWKKDHEDKCKACGGKMTVDAQESRKLGRRGIFNAIWALDNTHIMLMVVLLLGAMGMAGAFFYFFNQDTLHKTQLEGAKAEIARQDIVIETYYNMTGITVGR